jgi:hypothetical protein
VALVLGIVLFGVVVAVAAVIVVREAGRLAQRPPPALFDTEDAYEWVVEHLPDVVAATLTPADVRRILDFQIEFFERRGVSPNGGQGRPAGEVVVGGPEQVAFIVERAAATGEAYLPEQVQGVMDTQLEYLRWIGAVGPPAEPGEEESPPR